MWEGMIQMMVSAVQILHMAWQGEFPCLFRLLTGFYCLGCGGTRAARALLHGHFLLSAMYHPFVPYLAMAVPALFVWGIRCRRRKKPFSQKIWKTAILFGMILLFGNFFIKNGLLLWRGFDTLRWLDEAAAALAG